jgi:uncharacterized protein YheU (UPF0270 family)
VAAGLAGGVIRGTLQTTPMSDESFIEVPHDQLDPETLERLLTDVALRDDTDYGDNPLPLERRVALAREALRRGELTVVFDPTTETAAVLPVKVLRGARPSG